MISGFFKKNLVIQVVFNSNNVIVETVCWKKKSIEKKEFVVPFIV